MEVVNFCFIPGLGCLHLRSEWYLHWGVLEDLPTDWPNDKNPCCNSNCYVCNGSYTKNIHPIVYEGTLEFLESEYFCGEGFMPYKISHDNYDNVPNRLADSADWKKKVFGLKMVPKYKVNAFFFQLIGSGILSFWWGHSSEEIVCEFGTDNNDRLKYKNIKYWRGFTFRSAKWGGGHFEYISLLNK
mmetsp:Transcript_13705/g.23332  ORF Transcript_13705/g.23332 Transcript_13705/m.23332 type:complete len:186 (+) Transcript_13705:890-1447(+)